MVDFPYDYEPPTVDESGADNTAADKPNSSHASDAKAKQPTQATVLVGLAEDRYRFAQTDAGEPFAVALDGPNVARLLRGGSSLRAELALAYAESVGAAPSSSALTDALAVLEGRCMTSQREPVHLRVARDSGHIVYDLGGEDGAAVVIEPGRWDTRDVSPVLFRRTELTSPQALPQRNTGNIAALRHLLNVSADAFDVVVAWLVAALIPDIAHPILALLGEQGTGKSTTARLLAELVDPSAAPLRTAPRDEHAWAMLASGSWAVALDNISTVPYWLQDALCRSSTGDGYVKRRLYSEANLTVLNFRRVVLMTSIDPGALRGDLGDRLVTVDTNRVAPQSRRTEEELTDAFYKLRGRIFAALLDVTAATLAELPDVQLATLPRMADFARVVAAVDAVRGTNALGTYLAMSAKVAEDVVESDLVASAVRALVGRVGRFDGTASDLLVKLTPERAPKGWPKTAHHLSGMLKRAATALREVGIDVELERTKAGRTVTIRTSVDTDRETASPASSASPAPSDLHKHGDAGGDADDATAGSASPAASPQDTPSGLRIRPRGDAGDADDAEIPATLPSANGRDHAAGAFGPVSCSRCGKTKGHGPVDVEFVCSPCSAEQGVLL